MSPITTETEATLLLCGALSRSREAHDAAPLSASEFSTFLRLLDRLEIRLGDLLAPDSQKRLSRAGDVDPSLSSRVGRLLERGASLAIAVERWESRGVWVIDRSHSDYPTRYLERLGDLAPPLLFGAGDAVTLSHSPIVGVVGSRDLDEAGERFSVKSGRFVALAGVTLLSGGARGADRAAISGAVEEDGSTIAILPGDLERASTSRTFREAILSGNLALASPYHPNARFTVGSAMGRNRLIYTLSDIVIIVNSTEGSGGTWAGAVENLRAGWVPVFVRIGEGTSDGNRALIQRGARPVADELIDDSVEFRHWLTAALAETSTPSSPVDDKDTDPQQLGLFPR